MQKSSKNTTKKAQIKEKGTKKAKSAKLLAVKAKLVRKTPKRAKTSKNILTRACARRKLAKCGSLTFGEINPEHGKKLILILAIILVATLMIISNLISYREQEKFTEQVSVPAPSVKKQSLLEKQASKLVEGYPIAEMTPYIFSKDPKVAAFMIAIAKKESAWGKRKPVLDGKDCYNYWGFRLQSEKMGSGGHTCFDSPKQAVDVVASRLEELVHEENINSPKTMIVWKCGYGCQDQAKTVAEKKWINDVDMYYSKLEAYL